LERPVSVWDTIPGETPIDPSGLKVAGIITRAELNEAEAANVRKAIVKYLSGKPTGRMAPFDLRWARRLHQEMFREVWKWAGTFRLGDTNIGVPYRHIEPQLHTLLTDLRSWGQYGTNLVDQAVLLHHRAVQIHPFPNGNGRWSRLLSNVWLKLHDQPVVRWPEEVIGAVSKSRGEYIAAIRQADEGDYGPLRELHRKFLEAPMGGPAGSEGGDPSPPGGKPPLPSEPRGGL
jgi:Fic-DOC domain mobile mystery protein B